MRVFAYVFVYVRAEHTCKCVCACAHGWHTFFVALSLLESEVSAAFPLF